MKNVSKIIFALILGVFLTFSCGIIKPVPVKEITITHYRDSINWKDSTIYHHLYKEFYKDYSSYLDTLKLRTTYATAKAYLDTTNHMINGEIENNDIDIPIQIKWKERIVYKDNLVYKDVPVPVEITKEVIPKWCWYVLIYSIIISVAIFLIIYLKFLKK